MYIHIVIPAGRPSFSTLIAYHPESASDSESGHAHTHTRKSKRFSLKRKQKKSNLSISLILLLKTALRPMQPCIHVTYTATQPVPRKSPPKTNITPHKVHNIHTYIPTHTHIYYVSARPYVAQRISIGPFRVSFFFLSICNPSYDWGIRIYPGFGAP